MFKKIIIFLFLIILSQQTNSCLNYQDGRCIKCQIGYTLKEKYCQKCPSNCIKCQFVGYSTFCTQCAKRYVNTKYGCQYCGQHCLQCTQQYLSLPSCTRCQISYELYKYYKYRYQCKYVPGTSIILACILGPLTIICIIIYFVCRYIIKQNKQQILNSCFKVQVQQWKHFINTKTILEYNLHYKNVSDWKDLKHNLILQILEQVQASRDYMVGRKIGNYIYYEKQTEHRQKFRVISSKEILLQGHQIKQNFCDKIQFIPNYTDSNSSKISVVYILRISIHREDWKQNEISVTKGTRMYSYVDTSKAQLQQNNFQYNTQQLDIIINLIKEKYEIQSFSEYLKYYTQISLQMQNKSQRQLKISYKLNKKYNCYFSTFFPKQFNLDDSKSRSKSVYVEKKSSCTIQKTITLNFSDCLLYKDKSYLWSTPLTLIISVRPTGFIYYILSLFISKKHQFPIILKQSQMKQQNQTKINIASIKQKQIDLIWMTDKKLN